MKISTKGRYGLRAMIDIAVYSEKEPVPICKIAERQSLSKRQEISDKYLEQIISVLNKAGYVRSTRGPQGGYLLKKKPEEYTVGMILRLTEGSLAPVACVEDDAEPCERMTGCATVRVWQKINDAVKDVVDNITLADLVQWQLEENQTNDYCI